MGAPEYTQGQQSSPPGAGWVQRVGRQAVTVWDCGVHMDISGLLLLHPSADTSSLVQPIPSYPPGEPLWGPSASDTLSAHSSWHTLGLSGWSFPDLCLNTITEKLPPTHIWGDGRAPRDSLGTEKLCSHFCSRQSWTLLSLVSLDSPKGNVPASIDLGSCLKLHLQPCLYETFSPTRQSFL